MTAKRDANMVTTIIAVSSVDGVTPVTLYADPITHRLLVDAGSGTVGPGTINQIAFFDTTTSIASLSVATYPSLTELAYVKGVTSAIQTQLDGKQASLGFTAENVTNKVTSISGASTDTQYGSAKLLFDQLALKAALAGSVSQSFGASTIELGHATDTTIARVSAGVISVEGATVVTTAPGTSGNVLTSNGTIWTSAAPSGGGFTAKTIFPQQNGLPIDPSNADAASSQTLATNTVMYVTQVVIPFAITANKITILGVGNTVVAGTVDMTLYAEDGQSQIFSVTSGSIDLSGQYTTAISAVSIPAGIYYLGLNTNGTADIKLMFYNANELDVDTTGVKSLAVVSSEPTTVGTLTITASTPPATITLASITYQSKSLPVCRIDN